MALEIKEQTFTVPEDAQLKLSNVRGYVVIHAGEAGQIQVKAALDPESGDAERTQVEMHQEENGEVVVKTHYTEPFWGVFNRLQPCRVNYDVIVPANCRVRSSNVSGDLSVTGIQGKLDLSTVSGKLELAGVAGELSASTVSGGLAAHRLSGKLKAKSVSGSIHLEGETLDTIEASTVSGGIRLNSPLNAGPYHFHSVSGNIHWEMPASAACTIAMHTISGQMHINLPTTRSHSTGGTRTFWVMGGGTQVTFNSVSGSFYLVGPETQSEPVKQAAEQPAAAVPDLRNVLERIASGELSPEEGLQALKT